IQNSRMTMPKKKGSTGEGTESPKRGQRENDKLKNKAHNIDEIPCINDRDIN
ncbi:16666_t:CDS:1, partial [Acaulospora morrowiae]